MPELPEVETLCRQLQKKVAGSKIFFSESYDSKLSHVQNLAGRTITGVKRIGKTIELTLNGRLSVFIHLRMTGRLLWRKEADGPRHSRWRIALEDGNIFLVDPRRFATVTPGKTKEHPAGFDIIQRFNKNVFIHQHGLRKTTVKNLIMDQKAVRGIGNIYACEILHVAAIHPERAVSSLSEKDWQTIFAQAKKILKKAILKRGTSISDWRDLYGRKGENQHELKVYGREGEKCLRCGGTIRRIKQGGRSTFFCPRCQQ